MVVGAALLVLFVIFTTTRSETVRLLDPAKLPNGAWRVGWSSVPGATYELQRAANDRLDRTNWVPLASLTATGAVLYYDDFGTSDRRFYRVWLKAGPTTGSLLGDADHFVVLGTNGLPVEGAGVSVAADGRVGAFEYRPGGWNPSGAGQGFLLRFPEGARVVSNGTPVLQFGAVVAGFGSNSPFQLATNLTLPGSAQHQLSLAPLSVPMVVSLFGLPADKGLDVVLFEKFPLTLQSGVFEEAGIRGGRVSMRNPGFPLPGASGLYSDWVLDISPKGGLKIPFAGRFTLPDNSVAAPVLTVATNRPLWVEFKPGGEVAIGGRADLAFPDGPEFSVDFGFDDPHYRLQVAASKVHVPLLGALADLLPTVPTVADSTNATVLAASRAQIDCFDKLLLNFSAASAGSLPATADGQVTFPDPSFATASSALSAWGYAIGCSSAPPGASLRSSLEHAGRSASAAADFNVVLSQHLALMRIRLGVGADVNLQAEVDAALKESSDAIRQRAQDCGAVTTLPQLETAMGSLLEIDQLRQKAGIPSDPALMASLTRLLNCFLNTLSTRLGVVSGAHTAPAGGPIAGMNRFAALESVRQLVTGLAIAQRLGLDTQITAPVNETLCQLGVRTWNVLSGALDAAQAAGDYAAFTYAMEDMLDLMVLEQKGLFPDWPEIRNLPWVSTMDGFAGRLGTVFTADMAKPAGNRTLTTLKQDLLRLTKIIRQLPSNVAYPQPPIERALDRLEARLTSSFSLLSLFTPAELNELLSAGIAGAELRARFGMTASVSWEEARLGILVDRIALQGQAKNSWSALHEAVGILVAESDRFAVAGNQARRKLYLQKAAQLLAAFRNVAMPLRPDGNPLLRLADVMLPGDIYIDRVAGSVSYDRMSRLLEGALSGQMRMPKFNLSLTVDNASISSGGAFDLNAYGTVSLPPGSTKVTLSIPARRPLRLSYRPGEPLNLAVGARMALDNGMALESYVSLVDPVYSFGMSAEGLRFDLASNIVVMIPSFPDAAQFTPELAGVLNGYYKGLSASLDSLSGLTETPRLGEPGAPPEFKETTLTIPTDPIATFANGILLDLNNSLLRDYSAATNAIKEQLGHLALDTREQRDQLEQSEVLLRGRAMMGLYAALAMKAQQAGAAGKSGADCQAIMNSKEFDDYAKASQDAATRLMTRYESTIVGTGPSVAAAVLSVMQGLQTCGKDDGLLRPLLETYQQRYASNYVWSLGLSPATGKPRPGNTNFDAIPPEKLWVGLSNLFEMEKNSQAMGVEADAVIPPACQTMAIRYRHLLLQDLAKRSYLKAEDHGEIGRLTVGLGRLRGLHVAGGFSYPAEPILQLDGTMAVINENNASLEVNQNIMGVLNRYATALDQGDPRTIAAFQSLPRKYREDPFGLKELAKLNASMPTPLVQTNSSLSRVLNRVFATQLQDITLKLQGAWTTERMAEGVKLLDELSQLSLWAQSYNVQGIPQIRDLISTNLTVKMVGSARGMTNAWILCRYTELALQAASTKANNDASVLVATFLGVSRTSIEASAGIAGTLKNLMPHERPYDLRLPGDLRVRRAAGSITFNRQTSHLQGTFSGRVEFPDLQNASFEIRNATIDNDLNFLIDAQTSGPLPLDGVRLTASILASNGPNHTLAFSGAGLLTPTNGPDLAVALSFDTGTRFLSFDTRAGNLQSWRLTDNLVLFDAGFGFTLRPGNQSGELRASGSAGFFAKGTLPGTNTPLTETNFLVSASRVQAALLFQPDRIDLVFSNGTLRLPPFCYPTNMAQLCPGSGPSGPAISLTPANPIRAVFQNGNPPGVSFSGELDFRQFGLAVPGMPGMEAAVCSARLVFPARDLPYLTNVLATLQLPIPRQTNYVDLVNGAFSLDGYPSGRIQVRSNLTVLDLDGFKFVILGTNNPACPSGSGLTVYPSDGFGRLPAFKLDGGMQVVAPLDMLTGVNGDQVGGLACGSIAVTNDALPMLTVDALQFSGNFHLGKGGPGLTNALISFEGFDNLFRLDADHPFLARVGGSLLIPQGPILKLEDARFTFFDRDRLPKFSMAGLGVDNGGFTLMKSLPAQLQKAEIHFRSPEAELPGLLAPTNVSIILSAAVKFPATGEPMLVGAVENVGVEFDNIGLPRITQLDAVELGVGSLKLPPIKELGGRLRVGGLSSGDPRDVYMVGRLGGSYQGYQVIGQVAATPFGILGFCIDVNGGAAGIPVGPTGILITGANGGESFVNNSGDPCQFKTYFNTNAAGDIVSPSSPAPPGLGMTWEALQDVVRRMEQTERIFEQNVPGIRNPGVAVVKPSGPHKATLGAADGVTCPCDCPPATVNVFCQPHPDQTKYPGKIIAKFSSIDGKTLNSLGITPESMAAFGGNIVVIAGTIAHTVRLQMEALTPPPDPALLPPAAAAALAAVITNGLNTLETTCSNLLFKGMGTPEAGETQYATLSRLVYEGLPCPDVTMQVGGNVSYAGVSSMAYIGGKVTASTAGAAGVRGTVYVMGMPLGEARVFIAATDAQGMPNPSICGQVVVGFGPLDIGNLNVAYQCPGCVDGMLKGIPLVLGALSDAVLYRVAGKVAPELLAQNPARTQLIMSLVMLPTTKKLGIFAELASEPLSALPPNLPQIFFQGISSVWDSINPVVVGCGEVSPKIFGLPLGSKAVSAKMYATKSEEAVSFQFSPSVVIGYFIPILPGSDSGTMSMVYAYPDAYGLLFGGLAGGFAPENAVGFAQTAIDSCLQNSSIAVSYEIHPFGFELASAAGRVILPDLTTHPVLPWSTWVRPELRGLTNLPSRHDLLLQALAMDRLGDAIEWRGTTNDFNTLYSTNSPERNALGGLSLSKDYFPHGGVLGAARVTMPAMITEQPPLDKISLVLDGHANPLQRLTTAMDLIQNYVLRFNTNGSIAFYVPAPNPPAFYAPDGSLMGQAQLQTIASGLKPQQVLDSIKSFDLTKMQAGSFYPIEQAFLRGYLDGSLLGVPIVRADVVGLPADAGRKEGFLSITSNIPDGSWLKQFIPQASLIFDLRGVPPEPIAKRFADLLAVMQAARDTNANETVVLSILGDTVRSLTNDLPKAMLTADLGANLRMPAPVADLLSFNGNAHLHAFSVQYEPTFQPTNNGPLARVHREGGIAFQGAMDLKVNGLGTTIQNAELSCIPSGNGLPVLAGRFNMPTLNLPGVQVQDVVVNFSSAPNPHFAGAGSVSGLAVGGFGIQPLSGGSIAMGVQVDRTVAGVASVSLAVSPARLVLPSLYGETILIHGATRSDPFTFSTTGPWAASLELTNNLNLANLVSLDFGGLMMPITLEGNGTQSGSFTVGFSPSETITLFPADNTLRRTLTLSPGVVGSLRVNSDGTFLLSAAVGGSDLAFNGIPVPAGASLTVSNGGVAFTWSINNGTASASLVIPKGGVTSFSGTTDLQPLNFGVFRISGADGGNLRGSFNADGFLVESGAKLSMMADWLQNQALVLTSFVVSNNGAIKVAVSRTVADALAFGGYPFSVDGFTFQRNATNGGDGVGTLGLIGRLGSSPNFPGFPSLNFTGAVSSAGSVLLKSFASATSFFGFPVSNLTNTCSLVAGQYLGQLRSEFRLGDGSALWSKLGTNWFTGNLNPNGSMSLIADPPALDVAGFSLGGTLFRLERLAGQAAQVSLEGRFAPPGFTPIRLRGGVNTDGGFFLTPAPPAPALPVPYPSLNAQVSLVLANNGASVSGILNQPPLPAVSMAGMVETSGAFSLTGSVTTASINGFNLGGARFILQRTGPGADPWVSATGQLNAPLVGNCAVAGGFTNGGLFSLTGFMPSPSLLNILPVATMTNAAVRWTQDSLTLAGGLGGGVLATVLPGTGFSMTGLVNIASSGLQTLSGAVRILPFTNGLFTVRPQIGTDFLAEFDNAGLNLPAGALMGYGSLFQAPLPLPSIVVRKDGSFVASAGDTQPLNATIKGFGLGNLRFILQRDAAQKLSVPTFGGSLDIPGLNRLADVSGALTNTGAFALAGSFGTAVDLQALSLPIDSLGADAVVRLADSGLTVSGSIFGGPLQAMNISATGVLTVTPPPSVSVTLGGSVTIPPMSLGAFVVESTDAGGGISAGWTNNSLKLPSNLRVRFNNTVITSGAIPGVVMDDAGNFSLGQANVSLGLGGFSLSGITYTLTRSFGNATMAVSAGSISVPGLNTPLSLPVTGQLRSDSTYSFNSTVNTSGAIGYGAPLLVNLNTGAHVSLANGTMTVSGGLSGGVLDAANVGLVGSASGGFSIVNSPSLRVTPYASLAITPFNFGAFSLQPIGGGNFDCTLGSGGITIPPGAQVLLNGALLGDFSLPAIVIPPGGLFSGTLSGVSARLLGFNLNNVSLTFQRTGSTLFSLPAFSGTLAVPGLGWSVPIAGSIPATGLFDFGSSSIATPSLPGLPVTDFATVPAPTLHLRKTATEAALTVAGQLSGGILNNVPPAVGSVTGLVTVATTGDVTLSGSVTLQRIAAGPFYIGSGGFGNITASWVDGGLSCSGLSLYFSKFGSAGALLALPGFTIDTSGGFFLQNIRPASMSIAGFPFQNIGLDVRRTATGITLPAVRAQLNFSLPGVLNNLNKFIAGSVDGTGSFNLLQDGFGVLVGGFNSLPGRLTMSGTGPSLNASCPLDLKAFGQVVASGLTFTGPIDAAGNFSLSPTGVWSLSNLPGPPGTGYHVSSGSVSGAFLNLTSTGISGSDTLQYGGARLPMHFSGWTDNAMNFTGENGFDKTIDLAPPGWPGVHARFSGKIKVQATSADASFSCQAVGQFSAYDDLGNKFSPPEKTINLGTDGKVHIGENWGHVNGFDYTLW